VQVDGEFKGTCLMLQLDKPLSGLVKKVRGPVKACGFKIAKAVLWNADGSVFEHDDETDEPAASVAAGAGATPAMPKPTEEARKPATAEQLAYTQRLRKLRERYEQALREQHPESSKLRALMGFASEKADDRKDYAGAVKALEMLDKLLDASAKADRPASGAAPASGTADAGAALAEWQAARSAAIASLKSLAGRIAAARHASSAKALIEINAVMKNLSAAPNKRQQVVELQQYLRDDDVVSDVCDLAADIRSPMLRALDRLHTQLAG
jgi:hypothetical protein